MYSKKIVADFFLFLYQNISKEKVKDTNLYLDAVDAPWKD